jgi:glyoxylase-like metal-dependent hydrolase (beta-lactamase superfamily II)
LGEAAMNPGVTGFYHQDSGSIVYVVREPGGRKAAIVDSVLDFDPSSGRVSTETAEQVLAFVREEGLEVVWHLETHAHADHFSAASWLKERLGGQIAIGRTVLKVQRLWKEIYNFGDGCATDGSQFDRLLAEGDTFSIGGLEGRIIDTPGHTPANVTYVIGDAAFVADTIFQPDFGTARCDFPGGSARELYHSIQKILALPPETRLFTGHDYMPGGRDPQWESTVAEQRATNCHLKDDPSEAAFVEMREARDATLPMPKLILHALQININAGRLPAPESNGTSYLKIPLNRL